MSMCAPHPGLEIGVPQLGIYPDLWVALAIPGMRICLEGGGLRAAILAGAASGMVASRVMIP